MNAEELKVKRGGSGWIPGMRRRLFPIRKRFALHASRFTSSSGFSLVEVMIAIGIVAFAVVGILTAFPVGIEAARDSRDENTAAMIADSVFTAMRSQHFGGTSIMGGNAFVWPEVPMKKQTAGLKADYTGWTPTGSMYYYGRDGRPANADSTADGRPPTATTPYKGDEGYFGIRVYVNNNPYENINGQFRERIDDSIEKIADLACVIVEVSWPARVPYNNRKFKRQFDSAICNLH